MTRIVITQKDIKEGDCFSWSCQIARAINRRLKPGYTAVAGPYTIQVWSNPRRTNELAAMRVSTPIRARAFMDRFDEGRPVRPTWLNLDIPTHLLKEAA